MNSNNKIERIVILSNKSDDYRSSLAGWQSSLVLSHQLVDTNIEIQHLCLDNNSTESSTNVKSSQIITIDRFQVDFHNELNLDEASVMSKAGGVFVLANKYSGWSDRYFYHSTTSYGVDFNGVEFHHYLNYLRQNKNEQFFVDDFSISAVMAKQGRFCHPFNKNKSIRSTVEYGINFNSDTYQNVLIEKALSLGVKEIKDENVLSNKDPRCRFYKDAEGQLESICLGDATRIRADFFIDCTDNGLLTQNETENNFDKACIAELVNTELVLQCDYDCEFSTMETSNDIQVMDFGWINIKKTKTKMQINCFYDASNKRSQEMLNEVKFHTGLNDLAIMMQKKLEFGFCEQGWLQNCLAIGPALSKLSLFAENEFNHIRSILMRWLKRIPPKSCPKSLIRTYNRHVRAACQDVFDFESLHFKLNLKRQSALWEDIKSLALPEECYQRIELFKLSGVIPEYEDQVIEKKRWTSLLIGLQQWPKNYDSLLDQIEGKDLINSLNNFSRNISLEASQQHKIEEYLRQYCPPKQTHSIQFNVNEKQKQKQKQKQKVQSELNNMQSNQNIKKIVIAGGGTAGWMTAAAFSKVLGKDYADIILVESESIGTVSVGEATIPQISIFNSLLGIDENDFIKKTQATFKLGIEFIDWNKKGESYIHPFGEHGNDMDAIQFHHYWLKMRQLGKVPRLEEYSLAAVAARQGRFMRPKDMGNSPISEINYAFHFDATLYATYLRNYAEKRGVTRTEGKISDVLLRSSDGFIDSLVLESGERIDADLFVDCTGFRGLLIEGALKTGYQDWSDFLPCDTAVAMPCMSKGDGKRYPYTQSFAQDAGWIWRIPLQHRIGNGYVYPSKFISDDEAQSILRSHLETDPIAEPNFLKWKTGIRKKGWNKNCIAIGLSAGFVEPLESTGLHLIQAAIAKFLGYFPHNGFEQIDIDTYNNQTKTELEYIRDFIVLHYKATERDDTEFWRFCKNMEIPKRLQAKIDLYSANGRVHREDNEMFNEPSWLAVMNGQGIKPRGYHPLVDVIAEKEIERRMSHIYSVIHKSADIMPMQDDFIKEHCAADRIS